MTAPAAYRKAVPSPISLTGDGGVMGMVYSGEILIKIRIKIKIRHARAFSYS
jgi:hypothetical protein